MLQPIDTEAADDSNDLVVSFATPLAWECSAPSLPCKMVPPTRRRCGDTTPELITMHERSLSRSVETLKVIGINVLRPTVYQTL